ncbi:unnamed protein product [Bathycoccus prasinos]
MRLLQLSIVGARQTSSEGRNGKGTVGVFGGFEAFQKKKLTRGFLGGKKDTMMTMGLTVSMSRE